MQVQSFESSHGGPTQSPRSIHGLLERIDAATASRDPMFQRIRETSASLEALDIDEETKESAIACLGELLDEYETVEPQRIRIINLIGCVHTIVPQVSGDLLAASHDLKRLSPNAVEPEETVGPPETARTTAAKPDWTVQLSEGIDELVDLLRDPEVNQDDYEDIEPQLTALLSMLRQRRSRPADRQTTAGAVTDAPKTASSDEVDPKSEEPTPPKDKPPRTGTAAQGRRTRPKSGGS